MIPARFYIVGPEFHGYTHAAARAIATCGHEAQYDAIALGHNQTPRSIAQYYGRKLIFPAERLRRASTQNTLAAISAFCPHFLLIIKGDWLTADDLRLMRESAPGLRTILWAQDSISNIPSIANLYDQIDVLAVFEPSDLELPLARQFANSLYLPAAFDPESYFPIRKNSPQHHLAFVGAPYPQRRIFLERTGVLLKDAHLKMCIVGNFRREDPWSRRRFRISYPTTAQNISARELPPSRVNVLYSMSLAVLNMHHEQSRVGYNPRTVEILASGRPQLLDRKEHLANVFSNNDCVLYYDTPEEVLDHVRELMRSPELCARLSARAVEVARPHSMTCRMKQLIDLVNA